MSDAARQLVVELATTTELTYSQIAEEVGVSRRSVSEVCREAGIRRPPGPPKGTPSPLASFTRDDLRAALARGETMSAFAARHKVRRQAVSAAARRWGLRPRAKKS